MEDTYNKYETLSLEEMAIAMAQTRRELDDAKAQAAGHQKEWDVLRKIVIPNKMEELGIESVRITGVGTVSSRADAYCTVPSGKKIELMEWFRDNGMEDMVTETVNSSTLKAWVKEQIIEGNPVPDDIINFSPYTYVAITK